MTEPNSTKVHYEIEVSSLINAGGRNLPGNQMQFWSITGFVPGGRSIEAARQRVLEEVLRIPVGKRSHVKFLIKKNVVAEYNVEDIRGDSATITEIALKMDNSVL